MLVPLVVLAVLVLLGGGVVWFGRGRSGRVDDPRVAARAAAEAERTRAGWSCNQLPSEKPGAPGVRGGS